MKSLILDYTPFCTRAAIVEDRKLVDFSIERSDVRGIVGNIYKGKVENVVGGMQAAFVNIGEERNGFLYVGDTLVDSRGLAGGAPQEKSFNVSAGDIIMCQAVKDPYGQKGARISVDITLPGSYLVLMPLYVFAGVSRKIEDAKRRAYLEEYVRSICPEGMGFIVRTGANRATDEELANEIKELVATWEKILKDFASAKVGSVVYEESNLFERALRETLYADVDEVVVNDETVQKKLQAQMLKEIKLYNGERNIMAHYGVDGEINHLGDRKVVMDNGAYLVIDKTEALTVIDVNTGKYVGTSHLEDTVFKTNMLATKMIAKQLRLRNISGIVIIDFIDMLEQEHRDMVVEQLREELKADRLRTSAVAMTELGLVELTRKKTRVPVDDFTHQPCASGCGGYVVSDAQLAFMLRDELIDFVIREKCDSVYVGCNKDIIDLIFDSKILQRKLDGSWKDKNICFYADASQGREKWNISNNQPKSAYLRVLS